MGKRGDYEAPFYEGGESAESREGETFGFPL